MTTAKPPYKGDEAGNLLRDFSAPLRSKLRSYYPDQLAESDPTWGHPADAFVEHVLAEARNAIAALHWQRLGITKAEIRAELADILKTLRSAETKLRTISPDIDRLLDLEADNLGCADQLKELIIHFEQAEPRIAKLRNRSRAVEQNHMIAVDLAICILRAVKEYGIPAAATGDVYFGYTSNAVEILKAIGDDIGLNLSKLTWRDTIIQAKTYAPDLQ